MLTFRRSRQSPAVLFAAAVGDSLLLCFVGAQCPAAAAQLAVMRKSPVLPKSADELLEQLFTMFPEYRASYSAPIHNYALSFHSVLIDFSTAFGRLASTSSEKQLRSFGALVSAALEAGGALENAFVTCLLEHLHQIRAVRFRKFLTKSAREKTKG